MSNGLIQELSSDPTTFRDQLKDSQAEVTVIVVNYNSGGYLTECLEALSKQTFGPFTVVVVDNASRDASLSLHTQLDERFFLVKLPRNVGFAEANNLVGLCASSPWIATLNPDAIPAVDWLEQLIRASLRYEDVAMFGSTQIKEGDRSLLDGCGDVYSFSGMIWRGNYGRPLVKLPDEGEVFSPCAAAALYRTDVFQSTGGFDKRFFCYCEDVDLGFRIRLLRHRCVQVRDAVVYHVGSGSAGKRSDFSIYHGFRNRFWTYIKDMPSPLFQLLLVPHVVATLCHLLLETGHGQGKSAWKGLRDSLRGLREIWASRRLVQRKRRVSAAAVARALCWSPARMFTRGHDVRPGKTEATGRVHV
ncbi:MAG: glycosyltransferase family 2 protein [Desulfomonilaceae bacterium]